MWLISTYHSTQASHFDYRPQEVDQNSIKKPSELTWIILWICIIDNVETIVIDNLQDICNLTAHLTVLLVTMADFVIALDPGNPSEMISSLKKEMVRLYIVLVKCGH